MPEGQHPTFYSVLSHAPVRAAGNGVDLSIYHQASMGRSWGGSWRRSSRQLGSLKPDGA